MTHTPTPWNVHVTQGPSPFPGLRGETRYEIWSVSDPTTQRFTERIAVIAKQDDAARIVHCVNTHDALVEALGSMLGWLDRDCLLDCQHDPQLKLERERWIARAKAVHDKALAQAEKGA